MDFWDFLSILIVLLVLSTIRFNIILENHEKMFKKLYKLKKTMDMENNLDLSGAMVDIKTMPKGVEIRINGKIVYRSRIALGLHFEAQPGITVKFDTTENVWVINYIVE